MKGLQLLLQSLGIKIDPAQIEDAFQKGKSALPEIAQAFDEMKKRQTSIEEKLDRVLAWTESTQKLINDDEAERIKETFQNNLMDGAVHRA